MKSNKPEENLIDHLHKRCSFKGMPAVILNYEIVGDSFKIKATINNEPETFHKTSTQIEEFLKNFIITQNETSLEPQQKGLSRINPIQPDFIIQQREVLGSITNNLLDDLKKVREDPKYIKQAETVVKITNSIIDISKHELDAYVKVSSI